jgi:hypothetical protein
MLALLILQCVANFYVFNGQKITELKQITAFQSSSAAFMRSQIKSQCSSHFLPARFVGRHKKLLLFCDFEAAARF